MSFASVPAGFLFGMALTWVCPPALHAQGATPHTGTSRFEGTVTDTLGHPIADVRIHVVSSGVGTMSDSLGQFRVLALGAGPAVVSVRRLGYRPGDFLVTLAEDSVLIVTIQLTPFSIAMDTIQVRAPPAPVDIGLDLFGFRERRQANYGSGTFIRP